jgi:hypothetical protein
MNTIDCLAWHEPHQDRHIVEVTRNVHVIPLNLNIVDVQSIESSLSFIKYLHEHTNVRSYEDLLSILMCIVSSSLAVNGIAYLFQLNNR